MGKALVPIDGSEIALKAAKHSILFAEKMGLEILILTVIEPDTAAAIPGSTPIKTKNNGYSREKAINALTEAKEVFKETGILVSAKLAEGIPADEIVKEAHSKDCELIIMGSIGMGHGKLQSFFLGSVAEQVLRKVNIPVLIVKETGK